MFLRFLSTGKLFTLTENVDDVTGTEGDDLITGTVGGGSPTLGGLDVIDGGGGTNTLRVDDLDSGSTTSIPNADLTDIQILNLRSTGPAGDDVSSFSGLQELEVTKATTVDVTAGENTGISVSGATGAIAVDGGSNVTVDDNSASDDAITVGATATQPAGTISVTDAQQGTGVIKVDGGTDVTVEATADQDVPTSGDIVVGNQGGGENDGTVAADGSDLASGAVSVTQNLNSDATSALTGGNVNVTGGETVDVTVNANSNAADATASNNIAVGTQTVTAGDATTDVTITQNANVTNASRDASGGVTETANVQFGELKSGDSLTISTDGDTTNDGVSELTFTATQDLTAEEVAQAFSNVTAGETQTPGGPTGNGYFTGSMSGWNSGSASGNTVVFTSTASFSNATDLDTALDNSSGNSTDATVNITQGQAPTTDEATSLNDVTLGDVTVDDNANKSVTEVTVDGYQHADFGLGLRGGTQLNALSTLSLANSEGVAHVDTESTTLDLTVNDVDNDVDLDWDGASVTDLTLTAENNASSFGLQAAATKNLDITANADLDVTDGASDLGSAMETVEVSGSGAVDLGDISGATGIDSFDASGNSGGVTATVETNSGPLTGNLSEYVFSSGSDDVTLDNSNNGMDVQVTTGEGDDKVSLASGTTGLSAAISAGAGTDTLAMEAADAESASGTTTFEANIAGFEVLHAGLVSGTNSRSINLDNMDDIDHVSSAGTSGSIRINPTVTTQGDGSTAEVVTASFEGLADASETVKFDGTTINLTDSDSSGAVETDEIVTQVGAGSYTNWNATADTGADTVTFTYSTDNDQTDVTASDFTGTAPGGSLTLTEMANGGTLEMNGSNALTSVTMADASGSSDSFNIVTNVDSSYVDMGQADVAGVETINITANDAAPASYARAMLDLKADAATTVNVDGNSDLTLALDGATDVLSTLDASAMTGDLATWTNGSVSQTVTGGSGNDYLVSMGSQDALQGGEGNDRLIGNNLTELTGGAGQDTFEMTAPSDVNSYSSITDLESGDVIEFTAGSNFVSSDITLGDTAVFQDYANATVNQLDSNGNDVGWFEYEGDTYIIESDGSGTDFEGGSDEIIKIVGQEDLSTASYNQTDGTLEIA